MVSAFLVEWMSAVYIAVNRVTRTNTSVTVPEGLRVVLAKIEVMYVFSYADWSACVAIEWYKWFQLTQAVYVIIRYHVIHHLKELVFVDENVAIGGE